MKKFFIILVCCLIGTCAYSQDESTTDDNTMDLSWIENAPEEYLPAMTKLINSADSPCNTGGEAFKDFIARFRKNKSFRETRINTESEIYHFIIDFYDNFAFLKGSTKNTRCEKSYSTWYDVSADEVRFCSYTEFLCDELDGGGAIYIRFQRFDGKWYCTDFIAFD